ncbi:hypothetical protein CRG98_044873 [Punica granatum]|uniref:Uncharacterized protein n=1 Tax=Punica granatum TaxID=22663 RepID=A0A2I0HSP4_PUNGR|nr:hypothetical protein CRG98_044873 [Punica granatum]
MAVPTQWSFETDFSVSIVVSIGRRGGERRKFSSQNGHPYAVNYQQLSISTDTRRFTIPSASPTHDTITLRQHPEATEASSTNRMMDLPSHAQQSNVIPNEDPTSGWPLITTHLAVERRILQVVYSQRWAQLACLAKMWGPRWTQPLVTAHLAVER